MLDFYMRASPYATAILIVVVLGLLFEIAYRKSLYTRHLARVKRHYANAHNNTDRPFDHKANGDHRKTSEKVEEPEPELAGDFTYRRTTIIRDGKVTVSSDDPLPPEVQKEIDALFEMGTSASDSISKVFDTLHKHAKGK